MGRRAITQKDVDREVRAGLKAGATPPTKDDFITALMKYIPAEIVAAFVFIDGVMNSASKPPTWAYWAVFAALLVMTPLYLWRVTDTSKPLPKAQLVVSTIAFAVWVFAIGGPFSKYSWYASWYGAVILALYTVAIPIMLGHATTSETRAVST